MESNDRRSPIPVLKTPSTGAKKQLKKEIREIMDKLSTLDWSIMKVEEEDEVPDILDMIDQLQNDIADLSNHFIDEKTEPKLDFKDPE